MTDDGVSERPQDPLSRDYGSMVIPDDKPYAEFDCDERRAVLLRRIEQVGHPRGLNQSYSELADEFGTVKSVIADDMKLLAKWTAEHVERDHVSIMDAVFRRAVRSLVASDEAEDLAKAAEIGRGWFEWLADMGAIDRVPEKLDLHHTQEGETADYAVFTDEDLDGLLAHPDGTVTDPDALAEDGGE